jgi:hypothetical protein
MLKPFGQFEKKKSLKSDFEFFLPVHFKFFLYRFLTHFLSHIHKFKRCLNNFSSLTPLSSLTARSQVPSQVATHQTIGNQLWAGETPDNFNCSEPLRHMASA